MPTSVAALTALYELTNMLFRVFIQEASSQPNGSVVCDCLLSMYLDEDSAKMHRINIVHKHQSTVTLNRICQYFSQSLAAMQLHIVVLSF